MAQTPNPSRRSWVGPAPMPFLTPRPERSDRRQRELRWADGGSQSSVRRSGVGAGGGGGGGGDRDREVNVQVVLRCRPLSEDEQRSNVQSAISCNDTKREVTVLHSLFKQADKTFTFDKVFGPKSQQRSIYEHAVAPIVHDVLEGYNCTVFAFGQTGTGKTYTMEGEMRQKVGELSDTAGVIPRVVRHIFDVLETRKADYSMKVSFLELYNEDISDLLASEDQSRFSEDRQKRPISLMEDGKGGAIIRGLEEIVVYSPSDIYSLLECGSARRRTADTALNKQSSRSHAVFSIYIHVKETTVGNEELMKCGRLNLVDLAGSENIARSGAREANQKTCKSVMLKDIYQEMERMKQDVKAAREKNGIYIPNERFALEEAEKKTMREKIEHLELTLQKQRKEVEKYKGLYAAEQEHRLDLESQNKELKVNLENWKGKFLDLQEAHSKANTSLKEKDFIISNLLSAEHLILERAKEMRSTLENASGDITMLLSKLERQSKTEEENEGLLSDFRSGLHHSLGSANQLERRISKAKDMYASGVQCMRELANTLRQRSITDSEQMVLNISAHAVSVDNFLAMMVSEAEQVLNDVLKSTSELKELLSFSAEQQTAGLQRSLTSAQAMSKTSIDFFRDIRIHVSRLMKLMEQNQIEQSSQLAEFEEEFKETCNQEEQAALNRIAGILSGLTARKTTMLSECIAQLKGKYSEEQKHLKLEMSNLQQVSDNGKEEAAAYAGMVEKKFQEDNSLHAKLRDQMKDILQQWYPSHLVDLKHSSMERRKDNDNIFHEKLLLSSQNDAGFHAITSDMLTASENSLLLDHETQKIIESVSATFTENLSLLNEKHSENTESLRSVASNCLEKNYKANSPVRHHPRELLTDANSLESIEELRASVPDLVAKFRSESKLDETDKGKQYSNQKTRPSYVPVVSVFLGRCSLEKIVGEKRFIWRIAQRPSEERGKGKSIRCRASERSSVSWEKIMLRRPLIQRLERAVLEEQLYWARLERQKFVAMSAEADETIWNLAALARRTMQERDEARNQARMILAGVHARNGWMTMLPGRAHSEAAMPGVISGAGADSQALAPPPFRPLGDMAMQGQHAQTGTGYCVASSSNSGHRNQVDAYTVLPSLHGLASSTQEHFDPDMFLVEGPEMLQDSVPKMAGSSGLGKNSGASDRLA
ncbi:hypothetical protein EJB05_07121 [Eragrostis curvula]|uniref:Kinesin motor domain-containing protein n=1 Tax=Eragrostis curvula TaxID=38414 RepID=A0A5J9WI21_9POAL|nr:hypothetical protein EJB05_07121 [Eragrostis curvula]